MSNCPVFLNHDALHRALLLTDLLTGRKLPLLIGRTGMPWDSTMDTRFNVEAGSPGALRDRVHLLVSLPLLDEEGQPEDAPTKSFYGVIVAANGLLATLAKHPSVSPPKPVEVDYPPDGGLVVRLEDAVTAYARPVAAKVDVVRFPDLRDWSAVSDTHVAAEEVYVDGYPDSAEGDESSAGATIRKRLPGTLFLALHALQAARPESIRVRRYVRKSFPAGHPGLVVYTGRGLDFWVTIAVPLLPERKGKKA